MTKSHKTSTRTSSIRHEITLAITLLIIGISFALTILQYYRAKNDYREQLRRHLEEMAGSVAVCIDPDKHARLKASSDMETEIYSDMYIKLLDFKNSFKDIRYIYTMREKNNKLYYVIDADDDLEGAQKIGDEYTEADQNLISSVTNLRTPTSDKDFTKDRWGTWLSGYAPIITSEDKVDGFVGVDMAASNVISKEKELIKTSTIQLFFSLIFALVFGQLMGSLIATPIENLISRIKRMRHGNFTEVVDTAYTNEIGELTDQLNLMSEKMGHVIDDLQEKLEEEKSKTEEATKQGHQLLAVMHHSCAPFLLLENKIVVDCNVAAVKIFKGTHRINLLTRPWSDLSAEGSADQEIENKVGETLRWSFFDLHGEPFSHLIELTTFKEGDHDRLLVTFISCTTDSVEG